MLSHLREDDLPQCRDDDGSARGRYLGNGVERCADVSHDANLDDVMLINLGSLGIDMDDLAALNLVPQMGWVLDDVVAYADHDIGSIDAA
jgi:hypothetical protein